jgi:RNA polymerase sigma factor (sigma-70 family)
MLGFLKNITHRPESDEALIERFKQQGDLEVLGSLFQRYMDLVYGVCLKYLKDPESAQDAVMSIFEELILKVPKHDIQQFKGWLFTVSCNHCLMQLRSEKKFKKANIAPEFVQSVDGVHLNDVLEKEESYRMLEECLETLQAEQRESIRQFYLEGKCYKEISTATGLEWNQVRSYIQNGRRNLKNCIESKQNRPATIIKDAKSRT